jgi:hypothetical protein
MKEDCNPTAYCDIFTLKLQIQVLRKSAMSGEKYQNISAASPLKEKLSPTKLLQNTYDTTCLSEVRLQPCRQPCMFALKLLMQVQGLESNIKISQLPVSFSRGMARQSCSKTHVTQLVCSKRVCSLTGNRDISTWKLLRKLRTPSQRDETGLVRDWNGEKKTSSSPEEDSNDTDYPWLLHDRWPMSVVGVHHWLAQSLWLLEIWTVQ